MISLQFVELDSAQAAPVMLPIIESCFVRDFDNPSHDTASIRQNYSDSHIEIIFHQDSPIGYFAYHPVSKAEIYLKSVAVVPKYQNLGVGTQALKRVLALNLGMKVSLVVHPRNTGAIICYLRNGFVINGWKENCFGDGEPRIMMHKEQ